MKFFRNKYFRAGAILGLFILALLIVLPRTPISIKNNYFSYETSIGGYYLSFSEGDYVLDLREFKKGLDLEGGIRIVLGTDMSAVALSERDSALDSAREIIERRVNFLGVSEPYIVPVRSGDEYRLIVEIPGVTDISTALDIVGQTAQITFRQLKEDKPWDGSQFEAYYFDLSAWEDTGLTGADLRGANVVFSQNSGTAGNSPQIQIQFTNQGREKFAEIASNNINKPVGIFLDDDPFPLSMPQVNESFADGVFDDPVITGIFDIEQATNLSLQIKAGALPVPVEILQQEKIEASLGANAVDRSLKAGVAGFVLITIFMVIMYHRYGLIADLALVFYAILVLSIFKLIPVVLTLPGIAGFLLSIGMAVDANILIFERVKEELRSGKPRNLAVEDGFANAWSSIRDSNVSSLITAFILFYVGTGPIRGFALTLFIGISVSLFTAVYVVRNLITVFNMDSSRESKIKRIANKFKRNKNV